MAARRKPAIGGRKAKAILFLSVNLGAANEVPNEFLIFKFGTNPSEKGDFLFDQAAAESVMREYRAHGKPLFLDYNHTVTLEAPTPEQGIAAGEFTPEVRADGLYAASIKWTDRAKAYLVAKEYRCFSPTFVADPETGRVQRLINIALTNLPALDDIEPLVAASANGGGSMDFEKLYNELKVLFDAQTKELSVVKEKLSGFEAAEAGKTEAVQLRATVFQLTGKQSQAEAVGALQALTVARDELVTLKGKTEKERTERLMADFTGKLDQASKDGKITPAATAENFRQRGYWDKLAKERGVDESLVQLNAFLPAVGAAPPDPKQPESRSGGGALTPQRAHIARLSGYAPEQVTKWEADQAAKGLG